MDELQHDVEYMFEEEDFEFGSEMYMFEPEYTADELRLRNEARLNIAAASQMADPDENNPQRTEALFWCKCGHCQLKNKPSECLCCKEWPEWRWRADDSDDEEENSDAGEATITGHGCVTEHEDIPHLLARGIVTTFFHTPKINWKKRPKAEGENGQLSVE